MRLKPGFVTCLGSPSCPGGITSRCLCSTFASYASTLRVGCIDPARYSGGARGRCGAHREDGMVRNPLTADPVAGGEGVDVRQRGGMTRPQVTLIWQDLVLG